MTTPIYLYQIDFFIILLIVVIRNRFTFVDCGQKLLIKRNDMLIFSFSET